MAVDTVDNDDETSHAVVLHEVSIKGNNTDKIINVLFV